MSRTTKLTTSLATLALVGAGLGVVATGSANAESAAPARPQTISSGLLSPLSLAVGKDGTTYFTQNFAGVLNSKRPGKRAKVVYANKQGFEVGAISERRGSLRFALSKYQRRGVIMAIGNSGKAVPIGNLGVYEKKHNPDAHVAYGFRGLAAECLGQMPQNGPPASYKGIVETHPYATLQVGRTTYVADAAANAIFSIPRRGKVTTVAVIPPVPATITTEAAEMFGFPECAVGERYYFESVPTDVEVGPRGILYVSTLPGGPEDGSLGANARVYRVNPRTGKVSLLAGGLISATGLAVAKNGDVFVAELFRGRISKIKAGTSTARTFAEVPLPADVEVSGTSVWATIKALPGEDGPPKGAVVRFRR